MGRPRRAHLRSDRLAPEGNPPQPGFAPARRLGLERGRHRADEAAPLPLPLPISRERRKIIVPALSALGRHLSRRAVQYRELRALDPPCRARMRPRGWGVRAYLRRRAPLPEPRDPGARAAFARAAPAAEAQARRCR